MSYSFSIIADTKNEAYEQATHKFDEVLTSQPVHEIDLEFARTAVENYIGILADPTELQQLYVNVSGYVSWYGEGNFTSSNLTISASLKTKE